MPVTITSPTLHLVCDRNWMVDELMTNTIIPVRHSYGLDIPVFGPQDSWWIPQGMANRFMHSGMTLNFQAPGAFWLDRIPEELKGRRVETLTARDIDFLKDNETAFWKMAEAKNDVFTAGIKTTNEVQNYINNNYIPKDSVFQKSEILNLGNEYRFFIINGTIATSSVYLTRRHGVELTYYDYATVNEEEYNSVSAWVASIAPTLDAPDAYVLDVATTLTGRFIVLEANPAWCSAWYGGEVDEVVRTIITANKKNNLWNYIPDTYLVQKYSKTVPLKFLK